MTIQEICDEYGAVRLHDKESAGLLWTVIKSAFPEWKSIDEKDVFLEEYEYNRRINVSYYGATAPTCCGLSKTGITGMMDETFYAKQNRPIFEITDIVNTLKIDTNAVMILIEE